jgi:hypothetical protein
VRRDNPVRDHLIAREVLKTLPTLEEQAAEDAEQAAQEERMAGADATP